MYVLCICKSTPGCTPGCSKGRYMKPPPWVKQWWCLTLGVLHGCRGAALLYRHFLAGSGREHSPHGPFVSSVFKMQKEISKFQEQNTSYTEEILESSFASKLLLEKNSIEQHMGHEENWKRSLEEEITIIKSSNANLMMMMNNITLLAGTAPFLHAGCTVGRAGSSAPLAKLGQKPSSDEQITRARFGLPVSDAPVPRVGHWLQMPWLGSWTHLEKLERSPVQPPQIPLQLRMWLRVALPSCNLQTWALSALRKGAVFSPDLKPINPIPVCSSLSADY